LPFKDKEREYQYHKEHYIKNKEKIIARNKKWRENNPDWQKKYYEKNRERIIEKTREWYKKNRQRALMRKHQYDIKNKEKIHKREKERKWTLKLNILTHYGGNPPKCACCGETEIKFLSIDHIKGFGTRHRNRVKDSGSEFYRWLLNNNFPEGYQVLCYNCNCAKGFYGVCPHAERR